MKKSSFDVDPRMVIIISISLNDKMLFGKLVCADLQKQPENLREWHQLKIKSAVLELPLPTNLYKKIYRPWLLHGWHYSVLFFPSSLGELEQHRELFKGSFEKEVQYILSFFMPQNITRCHYPHIF